MKTYFISDTHFGHANIIKYHDRPYKGVPEMDKSMIENWNKVVHPDDLVWFLGDIAFYYDKEQLRKLVRKLNGNKRIILGNHDRLSKQDYLDVGFKEVFGKPVKLGRYILSHEPIEDFKEEINIHGHVHSRSLEEDRYYNVSIEVIGYKPISFDEVKRQCKMKTMTLTKN